MADIDWGKIAGPLAQAGGTILGGIVGGPAGAILGPVIGQVVGQALGVDPTPEAIGGALAQPPAGAIVQQIEAQHAAAFKSAEQLYLEDVQDARRMNLELTKHGSSAAWSAPVISLVVIVGFLVATGAVLTQTVHESQIAILLIGTLAAKFGDVVAYWIGSSKGSADKTATINRAIEASGPNGLR